MRHDVAGSGDADSSHRLAEATVLPIEKFVAPPERLPSLDDAPLIADPYSTRDLFHGERFHIMARCRRDDRGSSSVIDAALNTVQGRRIGVGLLDAALHGVPHNAPEEWYGDAAAGHLAFPIRVSGFRTFGAEPVSGDVLVEARPLPLDGTRKSIQFDLQISTAAGVWAEARIEEALVPKGRLGQVAAPLRWEFVAARRFVPGVSLSHADGTATILEQRDVVRNDWLPGTLGMLYAVDDGPDGLMQAIAAKEHVACRTNTHPSRVLLTDGIARSPALPLTKFELTVESLETGVRVIDAATRSIDIERIRDHWRSWTGARDWPVEHIYLSIVDRFLGRLHVEDPTALDDLKGKPALFLGNHQVGIESLVFSVACAAVQGTPILIIAKEEHKETWLGKLIALSSAFPGIRLPRPMMFFDRDDQASMLELIRNIGRILVDEGLSLMVHVDGTRALRCRQPVQQVSSVFLDLAAAARLPIVPIRFAGALPVEPVPARLEFPVGYARQDIHLGTPIQPDDLDGLASGERRDLVRDALNTTGPAIGSESPHAADPAFAAAVADLENELGMQTNRAVILRSLQEFGGASDLTETLFRSLRPGAPPMAEENRESRWIQSLVDWFRESA